ncbi:MAG: WXG100 family type VII secretion target [Lachnospiraceae bacterium]|nr:WXG100 family type VII secretion target [Lachnospiraceae bacterium]
MAITINLRVTPEELRTQKQVIDNDLDNIGKDIQGITDEINGTSKYWLGEAGDKQRNDYNDSLTKIQQMLQRLATYPERLMQMAGIYETAETDNTQTASQLKTDITMV